MSVRFDPGVVRDVIPHISGEAEFVVNPFTGDEIGELRHIQDAVSCDPDNPHEIDDAFKLIELEEPSERGGTHELHVVVPHAAAGLSTQDPLLSEAILHGPSIYPVHSIGSYIPMLRSQKSVEVMQDGHFSSANSPVVATDFSVELNLDLNTEPHVIPHTHSIDLVIANVARNLTHGQLAAEHRRFRKEEGTAHPLEIAAAALLKDLVGDPERQFSPIRDAKRIVSIFMNSKNAHIAELVADRWEWPFRACDFTSGQKSLREIDHPADFIADEFSSSRNRSGWADRAYFTTDHTRTHAYFERLYSRTTSPYRRPEDMLAHFILSYLFRGGDPADLDGDAMAAVITQINYMYHIPEQLYVPSLAA